MHGVDADPSTGIMAEAPERQRLVRVASSTDVTCKERTGGVIPSRIYLLDRSGGQSA